MSPFLQFRAWLRSGPVAERLLIAVVAALLLALVGWASVPSPGEFGKGGRDALNGPTGPAPTAGPGASGGGAGGTTGAGGTSGAVAGTSASTTGSAGGIAPGGSSTGSVPGGTTGGTSGATTGAGSASGTGGSGCGPLTATDQGVSPSQILVGVSLPDLGNLGAAYNVPTFEQQQKGWNAVFASYNKAGGVQCRRLVPKYYRDDVTMATAEHAACLQMQQDKVFAVIQNFYFPEESTCLAQRQIPNLWYIPPHTNQVQKYHPYILSYQPDYDRLVRDYVRGSQQLGWFAGHGKVGVLEGTCFPDLNKAIDRELSAIGIPGSQRSVFNYGCDPSAPSQPDKDTSAVLQFSREGVTHVVSVAYGRSFSFSSVADGQNYRPKYAVMDDGEVAGSNHSPTPTGSGFDGALAIGVSQLGAADTPGLAVRPATAECIRLMKAAGLPSPLETAGPAYGAACAGVKMFVTAASRAPGLTRRSLVNGLALAGEVDLSYPAGPADFHSVNNPTGGGFWRPLRYDRANSCWRVASPTYRKGFA